MYNWMKKNQKRMLAIFAAGLMIVFILPAGLTGRGGPDPVRATLGDGTKLRHSDIQLARAEWDALARTPIPRLGLPLSFLLASPQELQRAAMSMQFGGQVQKPYVLQQLDENPDLFLILSEEAKRMHVTIPPEDLDQAVAQLVQLPANTPADRHDLYRGAIERLLQVRGAFARAASNIKVSEPMREHAAARFTQQLKLNLVEIPAGKYAAKVLSPTTQQAQAQFDNFADLTGHADGDHAGHDHGPVDADKNPFGFGYKYPDRVKLQYIMVPREQARDAARKARTDYDWKVEAYKQYMQNPYRYPSTAPTIAPASTQEALSLDVLPTPAATRPAPTTRPFDEVREEIVTKLVNEQAEKLQAQAVAKLVATMGADYAGAVAKAGDAAAASTQPVASALSSLGVPYGSFEYLQKLRDSIQKEFGVLPTIESFGQFMASKDLGNLPRIGRASAGSVYFPTYAVEDAESFLTDDEKKRAGANALSLLEPSQMLKDFEGNAYVFRLTDAQPSHKPGSLAEVATTVDADVKLAQAYALAKADARKLFEAARASNSLGAAATSHGHAVVRTGAIGSGRTYEIPGYPLPPEAIDSFIRQAFDLLRGAKSADDHPIGLIELPEQGKVIVAELAALESSLDGAEPYTVDLELNQGLSMRDELLLQQQWFNFTNAQARLNYRPEDTEAEPSQPSPNPADQQQPLGNPFLQHR
ncbi:MAG: hypothetical protein ACREIT_03545 [Tepidisphaeraceae bacterium]